MGYIEFSVPTSISFETGLISKLPDFVKEYGSRVLILPSKRIADSGNIIKSIISNFEDHYYNPIVYDSVSSEENHEFADKLADFIVHESIELIIAIGGFNTLNIAKAAATVAVNGGSSLDFATGKSIAGKMIMPVICVPSRFATFAEITTGFYIRDSRGIYQGVPRAHSSYIYTKECVIDPGLVMNHKKEVQVFGAFSVFTYAFEVYVSKYVNSVSNALAMRAMEMVISNLDSMIERGSERGFTNIGMANILTPIAVNGSSLGTLWAISLAGLSVSGVAPEVTATVMLPMLMEYYLTAAASRFITVLKTLGGETGDISVVEAAIMSVENIRRLYGKFGVVEKLSEFGMKEKDIRRIAAVAMDNYHEINTVRRVMGFDDACSILEQAL